MKKITFTIIFLLSFFTLSAQYNLTQKSFAEGDIVSSEFDDFAYQYNRIISLDPDTPSMVIITFVFINGNSHTAITYRQENLGNKLIWTETANGILKKEGIVESLTASVPPNHIINWTCKYKFNLSGKNTNIDVDKAALLVMNDNYKISKIRFEKRKFKVR